MDSVKKQSLSYEIKQNNLSGFLRTSASQSHVFFDIFIENQHSFEPITHWFPLFEDLPINNHFSRVNVTVIMRIQSSPEYTKQYEIIHNNISE